MSARAAGSSSAAARFCEAANGAVAKKMASKLTRIAGCTTYLPNLPAPNAPLPDICYQSANSRLPGCFRDRVKAHQKPNKILHVPQRDHIRPIRRRVVRILMRLDEDAGDADRDCGSRQHWHEPALSARRGALPAGLLDRMGGVENDGRTDAGEDRQRAHVGHQRIVAE